MSELLLEFERFLTLLDQIIASAQRLRALLIANAVGRPPPAVDER